MYLLTRALQFLATVLVASAAIFWLLRILPGNAAQVALGTSATPEAVAALEARYGYDQPLLAQYFSWLGGLARGDFGESYVLGTNVSPIIADRVQVTLILVCAAMLLAVVIAVPLGAVAALTYRGPLGALISGASQLGVAVPGFLAAIVLVMVFSLGLGWFPANGWTAPADDPFDFLRRLVLPVVALGLVQAAILTRYVRSAVLDIMGEDFLRTARAKGMTRGQALARHGLRNAAVPVATVAGVQLATLLIGAVVIEQIFVLPGLGSELVNAVANRDLLMVQGIVMVLVVLVLLINFLVDVLYAVLDPRIRRAA